MIPAFRSAVRDRTLQPIHVRVLAYLQDQLDLFEFRRVKQLHLAKRLYIDVSGVSRALQHLTLHGYLEEGPPDGRRHTYRLIYALPTACTDTTSPAA